MHQFSHAVALDMAGKCFGISISFFLSYTIISFLSPFVKPPVTKLPEAICVTDGSSFYSQPVQRVTRSPFAAGQKV